MNDIVMVRFILKYGGFLNVMVSSQEAKRLIGGWLENKHTGKCGTTTYPHVPGMAWAVDWSSVMAVHTVPPESIQQQSPPQVGQLRIAPGSSGISGGM